MDKITEAREVALKVLKPSKKELAHGLELHNHTLVCEAYGFAPRGPVEDQDVISGYDTRSFGNLFEQKLHLTYMQNSTLKQECINAWKASGINCTFLNAGIESMVPGELIKRLARFTYLCDLYPDIYQRVVWPEQIIHNFGNGKISIGFATCGVPLEHELVSIESSLYNLTIFFQLGVRMMHLTYNRRNLLGDGCAEAADAGLSAFGHQVIQEMNKVGLIVDLAHSGQKTSFEAAKISQKPVIASHTVAGALSSHIRSKQDDVIRAIAQSGGYVGICALPEFLRGNGMIDTFLDHIDYVAHNFGVDHVAISTDNAYFCGAPFHWGPKFPVHKRFESYWTDCSDDFEITKEMESCLAWSNWPLFTVGLVQRGYSDDDISKILSGNFLRVLTAATKDIQR